MGEDLVVGEGDAEGVPSEAGEEPAADPFEGAPCGGASGDQQEIFWAGLEGGVVVGEDCDEPSGPEAVEEAEVGAE